MNKKNIMKLSLASAAFAGSISLAHKDVKAIELNNDAINRNEAVNIFENVYEGNVVNIDTNLRVRTDANIDSSVLGYLYNGQSVSIKAETNEWYRINFKGKEGYVYKEYIQINNKNITTDGAIKGKIINTDTGVNVRQSASINSARISILKNGDIFDIIAKTGRWYSIKSGSSIGFIHENYVEIVKNTTEEEKLPVIQGKVKEIRGSLNIRLEPNIDGQVIGYLLSNEKVEITGDLGEWYRIEYNNKSAYVSKKYVISAEEEFINSNENKEENIKILTKNSGIYTIKYKYSIDTYVNQQLKSLNMLSNNREWNNATKDDVKFYLDSNNFINNDGKYMFMKLNYVDGISSTLIDEVISRKGILDGKGEMFLEGARKYDINPIYLATHSRLETGNGTSTLAKGIKISVVDGKRVEPRIVYNMYGIGAADKNPIRGGAEFAYKQGWFTPEKAIIEGAKWVGSNYINNDKYNQNTLYKMKWNITEKGIGWHQYATDVAWADKQSKIMAPYLKKCNVALEFEIPKYK